MLTLLKKKEHISPGKIVWKKFISQKMSFFSLLWIVFFVLIAILGYLISPDSTPFANRQILEIGTKSPGSKVDFLKIDKPQTSSERGILGTMLFGRPDPYELIPYDDYYFSQREMILQRKADEEGILMNEISFCKADIIFPGDSVEHGEWMLHPLGQQNNSISLKDAESQIKKQHLVSKRFILGTDRFGRDLLSQIIIGSRVSLSVGFIAISISLLLGVALGSLAGFFRGRTDSFIVWLINVFWSIPTLLLVIAITFALGKGFWQIFVAVGLTMWVDVARITRGQVISLRQNEYIEAAKALGLPPIRIITKHLLPNIIGPLVVISAANFASAILIEAGLSFLGVGVQPPMPSWGSMIKENYGYIILDKAYLAIIPGLCIFSLVMAFMLVGNGLRDALDKNAVGNY